MEELSNVDRLTASQKRELKKMIAKAERIRKQIGQKRDALRALKSDIEDLLTTVDDGMDHLDCAISNLSELA